MTARTIIQLIKTSHGCGSVHETVPKKEHTKLSAMRNEPIAKEIGLGTSDVSFAATT
jgi:hypothetical protein